MIMNYSLIIMMIAIQIIIIIIIMKGNFHLIYILFFLFFLNLFCIFIKNYHYLEIKALISKILRLFIILIIVSNYFLLIFF